MKAFLPFLAGICTAIGIIYGLYSLVSHLLTLVPPGEYQGLIKIVVILATIFVGGGAGIALTIWASVIAAIVVGFLLSK